MKMKYVSKSVTLDAEILVHSDMHVKLHDDQKVWQVDSYEMQSR
jgi:hypothetical protein